MRSQGLEPSAKCFCSMHELVYETKAMGKEQYRPPQRKLPSANIPEKVAQGLDGGMVLREE
jgi:hypothetical protein